MISLSKALPPVEGPPRELQFTSSALARKPIPFFTHSSSAMAATDCDRGAKLFVLSNGNAASEQDEAFAAAFKYSSPVVIVFLKGGICDDILLMDAEGVNCCGIDGAMVASALAGGVFPNPRIPDDAAIASSDFTASSSRKPVRNSFNPELSSLFDANCAPRARAPCSRPTIRPTLSPSALDMFGRSLRPISAIPTPASTISSPDDTSNIVEWYVVEFRTRVPVRE